MQFVLDDTIFTQPNVSTKLITLFTICNHSFRHIVLPQNPVSQPFLAWLDSLPVEIRDNIDMFVNSSFRIASASIFINKFTIVAQNLAPTVRSRNISIDSALNHAQAPFRLYVENGRNDRQFLLAYTTPDQRDKFALLEQLNGLTFVHAGGITEMLALLQADIANQVASADYSWAVFDCDSLQPGVPSAHSKNLSHACVVLGIPQTQLQRRAIENYIPRNSLRYWVYLGKKKKNRARDARIATFQAYLLLAPHNAYHYNLKQGVDQDMIYAGVDPKILKSLSSGFGGDVAKIYHKFDIQEAELRADSSWAELSTALRDIERRL
jgi:hypothetical protein